MKLNVSAVFLAPVPFVQFWYLPFASSWFLEAKKRPTTIHFFYNKFPNILFKFLEHNFTNGWADSGEEKQKGRRKEEMKHKKYIKF